MSAVPDSQSGEVGGVQNTVTNLGASIGTALAGAVLISALTASFLGRVQENPAVSDELASRAQVELSAGLPFVSDKDVVAALDAAGVDPAAADAVAQDYSDARLAGLRASIAVLAVLALLALAFTRRLPTVQPAGQHPAEDSGDAVDVGPG